MYIRYFARTDESDLGRSAAWYCDALAQTGIPVRLVSTRVAELQLDAYGRSSSVWDRHRQLLTTQMDGAFVNVVCGEPTDWHRFFTPKVRNAILLAEQNVLTSGWSQLELEDAVALYDLVFAPSGDVAGIVERATGHRPIVVSRDVKVAGSSLKSYLCAP